MDGDINLMQNLQKYHWVNVVIDENLIFLFALKESNLNKVDGEIKIDKNFCIASGVGVHGLLCKLIN